MLRCLICEHAKNKDPSIPQIVSSLESPFMHFTGELFDESGCLAQTIQTTQVNGASHPLTFAVSARSPDLLVFIGKLKIRQRSAHHLSFGLGDTKHARRDSTHARGYNPTAGGNATHSDSHPNVMNTTTWWPPHPQTWRCTVVHDPFIQPMPMFTRFTGESRLRSSNFGAYETVYI